MRPGLPLALITAGGLATLIGMEFIEQFAAFGRIQGVGAALGGNPVLGLALVASVAATVTLLGLRLAHALVAVTEIAAIAVASWIVAIVSATSLDPALTVAAARRPRRRCGATSCDLLAHCLGLRAPPLTIV